ncbi:MAG: hypothetical protein ACR2OC_05990 [Solirubrobacterales bacterium]
MEARLITRKRVGVAILLAAVCWLALAAEARAGTYTVRECDIPETGPSYGHPDVSAAASGGQYSYANQCGVSDGIGLAMYGNQTLPQGSHFEWNFYAPSGTRYLSGHVDLAIRNSLGHHSQLRLGTPSAFYSTPHAGSTQNDTWQRIDWSAPSSDTTRLSLSQTCPQGNGGCAGNDFYPFSNFTLSRQYVFNMYDEVAPSAASLGGSLVSGGWKTGSQGATVSGSDLGSGVRAVELYVNGNLATSAANACGELGGGLGFQSMAPCPGSDSKALGGLNVGAGPFHEGSNTVMGYTRDLGSSPNYSSPSTHTVMVDSVAPTAVSSLGVAEGESWFPEDDFHVNFANPPAGQQTSPLEGTRYRITKVGGGYDSGVQYAPASVTSLTLDDQLPGNGHFQLKVWKQDAAGNHNEGAAQTVNLRVDETVPANSQPGIANGWIAGDEFPYPQDWSAVTPGAGNPSGIQGYAVSIDQAATSNPCAQQVPANLCTGSEVNEPGQGNLTGDIANLPEGSSYVHVVAVTGAGLPSGAVLHTELKVDKTVPNTTLGSVPDGWVNHDVALAATATDALSGMTPVVGDAEQPATFIDVNGQRTSSASDQAAKSLTAEGISEVRYSARDLAGNEGGGGSATVKVDKTAPQVAFENVQAAEKPELLRAPFTETLSGAAEGVIEYRKAGSLAWQGLPTTITGSALEAKVPSDDLADGDYEFRAAVADVAGNIGQSSARANGQPMKLTLPIKAVTALRAGIEGKTEQTTVAYGHVVTVSGTLRNGEADVGGERIVVRETYDEGSFENSNELTARTNGQGEFSVNLPAGPSRRIRALYDGSDRFTKSSSDELRLNVGGSIGFKVKRKRVKAGKVARFKGSIGSQGAAIPNAGKIVEVQFYDVTKKSWRTVDGAFRTNAKGAFRKKYRFGRFYTARTPIRFRAFLTPENGWPYGPKASTSRRVTVIPRG